MNVDDAEWQIKREQHDQLNLIGSGNFGEAFEGNF